MRLQYCALCWVVCCVIWGIGCAAEEQNQVVESSLKPFSTCDSLFKYIKESAKKDLQRATYASHSWSGFIPGAGLQNAPIATKRPQQGTGESNQARRDYSKTNNQVANVDEADLIKNDGSYLYILHRKYFLIVKAWPAKELNIVGRISLSSKASEMFVFKDKVAIFSTMTSSEKLTSHLFERKSWGSTASITRVDLLDISDKSAPKFIRSVHFEGMYRSARRIGQSVHVVLYSQLPGPHAFPYRRVNVTTPWERERVDSEIRAKQMDAIDKSSLSDWLPRFNARLVNGKDTAQKISSLKSCSGYYRPTVYSGRGIVSILSLQMEQPQKTIQHTSLISSFNHLYASDKAMYISGHSIDTAGHFSVHKFSLKEGQGTAKYVASGTVKGQILNSFSMDEYKGYLRIATTIQNQSNSISVLAQQGSKLKVVGSLTGLAPGEQIYSARFVKDRGFIVTFRRIDPLFTIDLSQPTRPRLVGELKIPGFSTYIHPLDRDHLLTIGVDGDFTGTNGNLQLAIFDVRDFAKPKQKYKYVIPTQSWSNRRGSAALYDHKAFNYFASQKMLAIPVQSHSKYLAPSSTAPFAGALLFKVDQEKGISMHGKIDHLDLFRQFFNLSSTQLLQKTHIPEMVMYRSAFVENFFYSISGAGIRVHALEDLEKEVASSVFPR